MKKNAKIDARTVIDKFFINIYKNLKIVVSASLITAWCIAGATVFKALVAKIYHPSLTGEIFKRLATFKVFHLFIL